MFQVLQDNKPCASYNVKGWKQDTFENLKDAQLFMLNWAYPYTMEQVEANYIPFKVNKEYDLSMGEFPVRMKIIQI